MSLFFMIVAAPMVLFLSIFVPPFGGTDEPAHFLRTVAIASGQILPAHGTGPRGPAAGGYLDGGVAEIAVRSPFPEQVRKDFRMEDGSLAPLYRINSRPDRAFVPFSNTAIYPPQIYLPSVLCVWLGRALGWPVLWWLYLERIVGGLFAIAVIGWAIKLARDAALPLTLLALLPETIFQIATVSTELVVLPLCFLFAVLVARMPARADGRDAALLALVTLVVAPGKIAYLPLAAIPVIIAWCRDRVPTPRVRLFAAAFGLSVLIWAAWAWLVRNSVFSVRAGVPVDPHAQLQAMLSHPTASVALLGHEIVTQAPDMAAQLAGQMLGWGNYYISRAILLPGLLLLVAASFLGSARRRAFPPALLSTIAVSGVCSVTIYLLIYLQFNAVGAETIYGVQGRYFLPLVVVTVPVVPRYRIPPRVLRSLEVTALGWCLFASAVLAAKVYLRFW